MKEVVKKNKVHALFAMMLVAILCVPTLAKADSNVDFTAGQCVIIGDGSGQSDEYKVVGSEVFSMPITALKKVTVEVSIGNVFNYNSFDYTHKKAPVLSVGDTELGEAYEFAMGYKFTAKKYKFTINAGEIVYLNVTPGSDWQSDRGIEFVINISATSADTGSKYENSKDKDKPLPMTYGTTYGFLREAGKLVTNYYTFTLTQPGLVTLDLAYDGDEKSEHVPEYRIGYSSSACEVQNDSAKKRSQYKLQAGTYYIAMTSRVDYTVKVTKEDFTWGKLDVQWSGYTFTANYTPDSKCKIDTGSYLANWNSGGSSSNNFAKNTGKATDTVVFGQFDPAGWKTLKVTVVSDYGTKTYSVSFAKLPEKINYNYSCMTAESKRILFNGSNSVSGVGTTVNGDKVEIQMLENSKWKTVKTIPAGGTAAVTGLKYDTTYKFRLLGVVSAQNGKAAIYGVPSDTFTVKTGAKKPSVKSVKINKGKVKYIKKEWHPGHYIGKVWSSGYYTGGYYETSYRVTVTLKKALKGQKGLVVNDVVCKGKGKKYTVNMVVRGKKIGKKVKLKVRSYNNSQYKGYSDAVSKSVKIKK